MIFQGLIFYPLAGLKTKTENFIFFFCNPFSS